MAAPMLKRIFQQSPEVAGLIDNSNELIPRVPANRENLECLLKDLRTKGAYYMCEKQGGEASQGLFTKISILGKKRIECVINGPNRVTQLPRGGEHIRRPNIEAHTFDNAVDGLSECIALMKDAIHRYRTDGICTSCCTDFCTTLKAPKMPRCHSCIIHVSTGLRP